MTLTKSDLKKLLCNRLNIPKAKSNSVIDSFLENIKEALESGEDVMISGFGKFSVQKKDERRGRNPHTGKELMINSRRVVTFRCSGKLRDRINEG